MRYWFQQVLGWVLIGFALFTFYQVRYIFLDEKRVIEAVVDAVIGVVVFRGGIHLLKVATAARAAMEVRKELAPPKPLKTIKLPGNDRTHGRQRPSVVPGAGERRAT